jgi:putative oxidoreductase
MRDLALAVGRIALVVAFVWSGFGKLMGIESTALAIGSKNLPIPLGGFGLMAAAIVAGLVELGCGLMIAVGFWTRVAAIALLLFTLAATILFHDFWAMTGQARSMNLIAAMKNLAMMGGLLIVASIGAGRFSIDGRRHP